MGLHPHELYAWCPLLLLINKRAHGDSKNAFAEEVHQTVTVDVIHCTRKTDQLDIKQLIDSKHPIVINMSKISVMGSLNNNVSPEMSVYIWKKGHWFSVDNDTISCKTLMLLRFKWKKAYGDSIRIVEKDINAKNDSIVLSIKIPANEEEENMFYSFTSDKDNYKIIQDFQEINEN